MFKDLYKQANDRIDTKEPFERMMKNLENAPQSADKKIAFIRKAEYAATLAACVCLTFVGVKVYNQNELKQNPVLEIQNNVKENNTLQNKIYTNDDILPNTSLQENTQIKKEVSPDKSASELKIPTKEKYQQQKTDNSAAIETAQQEYAPPADETVQDSIIENNFTEQATSKIHTDETIAESAQDDNANAPIETPPVMAAAAIMFDEDSNKQSDSSEIFYGSAGGNSRSINITTKEITLSEYYDYLGKKISMPEGYEIKTDNSKLFEVGENGIFTDDRWTIVFEKGNGTAEITPSKDISSVKHYFETYVTTNISGVDAAIFSGGDAEFSAYMISDDIAYEINTANIDKEELKKIISSLAE